MHSIEFKGISNMSYRDLFIHKIGNKKRAKERVIIHDNIKGRDGLLIEHTNRYEAYERNIQIWDKEYRYSLEEWLHGYGKLKLSTEPNGFYKAHCIDEIDIIQTQAGFGRLYDVTFLVQPFFYLDVGEVDIYIKQEDTIKLNNSYDIVAKPYIELIGIGNLEFWFNGELKTIKNVNNRAILDSELMEIYDKTKRLPLKMYGEFPKLELGINTIKPINCDMKIKPRWCKL